MRRPNLSDGFLALQLASGGQQPAALISALAQSFVESPRHSRLDLVRFEELTQHFLGAVSPAERREFALAVAHRPDLPRSVVLRLAFDEATVAEPVVLGSPALSAADLAEITHVGAAHRAAVKARRLPSPDVPAKPAARVVETAPLPQAPAPETSRPAPAAATPEPAIAPTLPMALPTQPVARAAIRVPGQARPAAPKPKSTALENRFLEAGRDERIAIVETLGKEGWAPDLVTASAALQRFQPRIGRELIALAAADREDDMVCCLAAALRVPDTLAGRILGDADGEPLMVAARALGVGEEVASELAIACQAGGAAGRRDFLTLVKFFRQLSKGVADRLITGWLTAETAKGAPADTSRRRDDGVRAAATSRAEAGAAGSGGGTGAAGIMGTGAIGTGTGGRA
ncbi:MAG: hypothetical protein R3D02_03315 [Hyphomicrobiales bacterium]